MGKTIESMEEKLQKFSDMPLEVYVRASIEASLTNLGLEYADCILLRRPYPEYERTMEAWRGMEAAVELGFAKQLGIANVESLELLERLYEDSEVKPAIIQTKQ